ncbi:MAG: hypothetical protein P4L22_01410 [Candidatus Babeliales bacterium]|nr:hypothetical protein [Candidatus Babeliales bacterium]
MHTKLIAIYLVNFFFLTTINARELDKLNSRIEVIGQFASEEEIVELNELIEQWLTETPMLKLSVLSEENRELDKKIKEIKDEFTRLDFLDLPCDNEDEINLQYRTYQNNLHNNNVKIKKLEKQINE